MSEYAFGEYQDSGFVSEEDEPPGSQSPLAFGDFPDYEGFQALIASALRQQLDRHKDVLNEAIAYLPQKDSEMLQVFENYGLMRSGSDFFVPESPPRTDLDEEFFVAETPEYVDDSIEVDEEPAEYVQEAEFLESLEYVGLDDGQLEFETIEQAEEYAMSIARGILDEIFDEIIREEFGAPGIVTLSAEEVDLLCREKILPAVWAAMDE